MNNAILKLKISIIKVSADLAMLWFPLSQSLLHNFFNNEKKILVCVLSLYHVRFSE